jgi:peroxiredoxin
MLCAALLMFILLPAGVASAGSGRPTEPAPGAGLSGSPAPDFTLPLVGGGEVRLADLRGKLVLVNFWATWCPPCVAEMPSMERLYAQLQKSGLEILAINAEADGLTMLPDYLKKHPHTFPVPVDTEGNVQELYGVFRFPESFIIGRDGKVVDHIIGGRDWSEKQAIDHFKSLLAE